MSHSKQKRCDLSKSDGAGLFQTHLSLIEGGACTDNEEKSRIASMTSTWPRALELSRRSAFAERLRYWILTGRRSWFVGGGLVAATCLVAIVVYLQRPVEDLMVKGLTKVFVIIERQGETLLWQEQEQLTSGTRVNAEVLSDEPSIAFLGVYGKTGQLLSDTNQMAANALNLTVGQREPFRRGFELTGENEGETLVVVVCSSGDFAKQYPDPKAFVEKHMRRMPASDDFDKLGLPCGFKAFRLRW